MTYRLTPEQAVGIAAVNKLCREHDLPEYIVMVLALAGITTAVRDGKPTAAKLKKAIAALEGLRNDSAESPKP